MKKLIIASLAGLGLASTSAFAADLPYKAPPPPPVYSWTGCNINVGGGGGMWNQDQHEFNAAGPTTGDTTIGGRGYLGRVGVGCDYQFGGRYLLGAFADYDFMGVRGNISPVFATPAGATAPGNFTGTETEIGAWYAGGRLGYLITPTLMTYFDGGYTETRFGGVALVPSSGTAAGNFILGANTYRGWFIGGGDEYALGLSWLPRGVFWRTEYRFAQYRSANLPILTAAGAPTAVSLAASKETQTITSGLVWRFNWGGYGGRY